MFFDLALHVGTLAVILVYFRATIGEIAMAILTLPKAIRARESWRAVLWDDAPRRLALLVVLGSVPTAIIAFSFEDRFLAAYESPFAVGIALLVTGTMLWATRYASRVTVPLGWRGALLVGAFQGAAVMPGISRSGATISAARFLGVDREVAVRYSFLLSIPAIVGATLFQADATAVGDMVSNPLVYAVGILTAIAVGYAALAFLVQIVKRDLFHYFAFYCWGVGALVLVLM